MRLFLVAAALLLAPSCDDGQTCDGFDEIMERVAEPPPAEYETQIRACESNLKQCLAVCNHVLADHGLAGVPLTECMVMHDATGHDVLVGYEVPCAD